MKLTNLTKSVLAASALTVASFGTNASAIATVDLNITNFAFLFQDSNGNAIDNSVITTTAIDFTNSQTSATVNGNANSGVLTGTLGGNFDLAATNGSGNVTSGTGGYGLISFNGAINALGGANALTSASSSAYGLSTASSSADVLNSFDATFDFAIHCTTSSCVGTTVSAATIFGWNLNVLLNVFDQGKSANASWSFGYSVKEKNALGGGHNYSLTSTTIDNSIALNNLGLASGNDSQVVDIRDIFSLNWDTTYTIAITQKVSSSVTSVPEPTSVAILGLGLIGLAGAARRRKS